MLEAKFTKWVVPHEAHRFEFHGVAAVPHEVHEVLLSARKQTRR